MLKINYNIEGNINFQDELKNLLNNDDNEDENQENICQISGYPLTTNFVTLDCNHKFNYVPLYKELTNQRYKFKNYSINSLSLTDRKKLIESTANYFIKCPYCRNIQFTILPYYEELGLNKEYGINSLDPNLPNPLINLDINTGGQMIYKGLVFKNFPGIFCNNVNIFGDVCTGKYVNNIPNTQLYYCCKHYSAGNKKYKMDQAKIKKDLKTALTKEKEAKLKQLHEINEEKLKKGLKQLPKNTVTITGCTAILKTGINKGNACGCFKIEKDGLCKRHANK